jgi:hypothetical protein
MYRDSRYLFVSKRTEILGTIIQNCTENLGTFCSLCIENLGTVQGTSSSGQTKRYKELVRRAARCDPQPITGRCHRVETVVMYPTPTPLPSCDTSHPFTHSALYIKYTKCAPPISYTAILHCCIVRLPRSRAVTRAP